MTATALAALASAVREAVLADAARLGLDPGRLEVRPLLNLGGFVNRSFGVSDGRSRYHVKLTCDPAGRRGLERWRALHTRLEERYRAPRLVSWLALPDQGFAGPVLQGFEGRPPSRLEGGLKDEVALVVAGLHADAGLAGALAADGDEARSCARAYLDSYHDRLTQDLEGIEASPPPFVSPRLLRWMWDEAAALEADVRSSAAFTAPAASPVHGDLWVDNLLVAADGSWALVDWDGLSLGDPALDWAMLLGPSRDDLRPASEKAPPEGLALDGAEAERLRVHARASLLDWTIDPLADWVEAEREPEHGAEVRRTNERVHREALALYRRLWG